MQFLGEWFRRLQYLLNRRRLDAALTQEMEAHRAEMGRPAAFGNVQRLREEAHDVWGWNWLDHLVRDLRFGARALRRTPGFAIGAVLSLALGFALAATAVSVSNAYLLRSQPYEAAERVYYLRYAPPGPWEPGGMTALDWRSVSDVVEFAIASAGETFYLSDGPYAQAARVRRVTAGFIGGLGVRAVSGRTLIATDFQAAAEPVALIGYDLWRDRYGSDPGAIGRELQTENEAGRRERFRIVGVLPPNFYVGNDSRAPIEIIVPLTAPVRTYMVRLQPGVPVGMAEQRITVAARAVARDLPADWTGVPAGVRPRTLRGRVPAGAVRRHDRGRTGAGHRLRQRRRADRPPDGAPAEGDRAALVARRQPLATRPDARGGGHAALHRSARGGVALDAVGARCPRADDRTAAWPAYDHRRANRDRCHGVADHRRRGAPGGDLDVLPPADAGRGADVSPNGCG